MLHLKYVSEHVPGGTAAFSSALGAPALRAFFEQPFNIGVWYDVMPLVEAGHVCAKLAGTTFEAFVRTRSRHQFDGDLQFFRKLILRLASPSTLATKIPPVVASYWDFVECDTDSQHGNAVSGSLRGVPRPVADWVRFVFEEFVHRALEVNGVTRVGTRWKAGRCALKRGVACDDWSYVIEWT
jgi:hypothetical protein